MNFIKFNLYLSIAFLFGCLGFKGAQIVMEGKAYGQNQLVKGGGSGPSWGGGPGPGTISPNSLAKTRNRGKNA